MRVLLVSTYELGHQPVHLASPAAALRRRGHDVRCLDLSVQPWDPEAVSEAEALAFSVPMHTAMRLALVAAEAARRSRPDLPICFYGLYAAVSSDLTLRRVADRVIAGEYEPALVDWVEGLAGHHAAAGHGAGSAGAPERVVALGHTTFPVPARDLLPPLERYAHLAVDGEERLVGCVEASHGCASRCRHCPVPSVYDGRIRVVGPDVVLADIEQLVDQGARHITFADPDFLNGVHHSLRVVRSMHERFPHLTFDCTTKVELVLRHRHVWDELAAAGCLFAVSALECVNDDILGILDKGHTTADAAEAVAVLRASGIEPRPSFLPFTPWTSLSDMVGLMDFVAAHDLVANVDPVHYTIRLLVPEGSLLLDHPALAAHLGGYDPERLSYRWTSADPRVDRLQAQLAELVERGLAAGEPTGSLYLAVSRAVREAAGEPPAGGELIAAGSVEGRPRLTEPWFC
ncbi:MAG: CUAEP/CCAEP-tail radical SAM protein [Actinomycetota bacterium]|nr:CUAEP/CCAEP-tail radical SAM protein [Actinomycetota bacterium]